MKAMRKWRAENPEAHRAQKLRYRQRHAKEISIRSKDKRAKLKLEVIAGYGGACTCCGENHSDFLTLDHVNNDGAIRRMELGRNVGGTSTFYRDARNREFPPDYTILCFNCNIARSLFGTCPHQR